MKLFAALRSFVFTLTHRSQVEREMDEELRSHIELHADDLVARHALPRAAAERRARMELGSRETVKEECREAVGAYFLETLPQDIRFGFRTLRKNPGFTAIAILTLALGIGANAAIFSVIESTLLHPVPWKEPDRIVGLWEIDSKTREQRQVVSPANFLDWRERTVGSALEPVAAWHFIYLNLAGREQPEQVEALAVTSDYFQLLGYQAAHGRTFLPGDSQPGRAHTVVLSHDFWRRRFNSDTTLVGRTLQINGEPYTVIGILPSNFHIFRVLNRELDLFVPLTLDAAQLNRADDSVFVYARLKQGASLAQAQSETDSAYRRLAQEYPATNSGLGAKLTPLHQQWTGVPDR
jgi:hypothetical protein